LLEFDSHNFADFDAHNLNRLCTLTIPSPREPLRAAAKARHSGPEGGVARP